MQRMSNSREHNRRNSRNIGDGNSTDNSGNIETTSVENGKKDLSIFQALGNIANELNVYSKEYEEESQ